MYLSSSSPSRYIDTKNIYNIHIYINIVINVCVKQINCKTYYDDISSHLNKYDIFDFHFQVYCTTAIGGGLKSATTTKWLWTSQILTIILIKDNRYCSLRMYYNLTSSKQPNSYSFKSYKTRNLTKLAVRVSYKEIRLSTQINIDFTYLGAKTNRLFGRKFGISCWF